MAQFFKIHPQNPQARLISQSVRILQEGGVIAYPTDSSYALGCIMGNKAGMQCIRRIRRVDEDHNFTLVCRDLSEISIYARVGNETYRLLKRLSPGPYTFILPATREVPRRLHHAKRRTIGIRVPDSRVVSALLEGLGGPLMSSTLILPGASWPLNDAFDIRELLEQDLELVIDSGPCEAKPTTVLDLTHGEIRVLRQGRGDLEIHTD